ncbi:hypothetical protein MMC30_000539 [Trapelia coarctata]|nr:hypothetical protein [Trapelia coarctata]
MSSPNLLITGATGHVGFRTLVEALKAGYIVRAAIRSAGKADEILATPSIKALGSDNNLSFVVVPDILADGAYEKALEGITYVVHLASPFPMETTDYDKDVIQPAIKGTTNILFAAKKVPTVKRVVITSSAVAVIPLESLMQGDDKIHVAEDRVELYTGPLNHPWVAYIVSKVKALQAAEDFTQTESPAFDIIHIHPGFVIGRNELALNAEAVLKGSNDTALAHVLSTKSDPPRPGGSVHLHDAARLHILALDPKVKGGQSFLAATNNVWNDSLDIVKKHFPQAVKDGKLPADGNQPTLNLKSDSSRTEDVFGFKFQDYEAQVVNVTEQYLELLE